ncbi:MAG: histidine phosphatase family protein [Actinomycetota bacterium]|nr:histidine phosphatase family protein [Actinomycetota bacterium]
MSRRVVVVRHGRTAYNHEDRWQGQLDVPLDEVGRHQATLMGPQVGSMDPVAIVSSDLSRALETAAEVAKTTGLTIAEDQRLREIHAGQWQGLTGAEVRARFPGETERIRAGEDIPRGIDGETWSELGERVAAALADFASTLPERGLGVAVTHGAAARAGIGVLLGLPFEHWRILGGLGNCAWAVLEQQSFGWRLGGWNLVAM